MMIDGIGRDSVQPVAKLCFRALETMKILNHFEKYFGSNILGLGPVKQSVSAVSEYHIVMPAVQLYEGCSIAASLNYQFAVFIHVCCTLGSTLDQTIITIVNARQAKTWQK